jgi:hypothetical protein
MGIPAQDLIDQCGANPGLSLLERTADVLRFLHNSYLRLKPDLRWVE